MADEVDVLFVRGSGNKNKVENEDVWDDSVLIEAYEKAVNATKEEILKRICPNPQELQPKEKMQNVRQQKQASANKVHKKWTVGARCRAVYTEDGEVYEAVVLKVFENTSTCIVKFAGYGNTQKVKLDSLLDSEGLQSILAQEKNALTDKVEAEETIQVEEEPSVSTSKNGRRYNGSLGERMECETENVKCFKNTFMAGPSFNSIMDTMPPAPPLPPQLMAKLPENDADALSSMLMSWYISGFHTGYYHGLKQAQSNHQKRKTC